SISKPVCASVRLVSGYGVAGDLHAGGAAERAVCLMRQEWLDEFAGRGMTVPGGAMGENLLLRGLPASAFEPGARLRVGRDVVVEVTAPRTPCRELEDVAPGLLRAGVGRSGYFARVVTGGSVRAGDGVDVLARGAHA